VRVRRYDVALDVNVMGVKHICQLAKQCPNLEVVLHVSTGKGVLECRELDYYCANLPMID